MSRNTEFCLTNDLPSSGPRSYEHSFAKDRDGVKSSLPKILESIDRSRADDIQRLLCHQSYFGQENRSLQMCDRG